MVFNFVGFGLQSVMCLIFVISAMCQVFHTEKFEPMMVCNCLPPHPLKHIVFQMVTMVHLMSKKFADMLLYNNLFF